MLHASLSTWHTGLFDRTQICIIAASVGSGDYFNIGEFIALGIVYRYTSYDCDFLFLLKSWWASLHQTLHWAAFLCRSWLARYLLWSCHIVAGLLTKFCPVCFWSCLGSWRSQPVGRLFHMLVTFRANDDSKRHQVW